MPTETVAGFWSYAHEDDKLDGGAILKLAHLIKDEYNLISGEPLELFIDKDGIAWGDEWRKQIDSALTQTTFFIPVITPRYFVRPECRRELLEFSAKAKGFGVEELLLPILYVEPQNFSAENPDEAVALVARTQYADWRTVRLAELTSREYRISVNVLARRILEIAKRISEGQFSRELVTDPFGSGIDGITDVLEEAMGLLPEWLDAVMGEKVNYAQAQATWDQCMAQVRKVQRRNAPASAVISARIRAVKEMLPLLERTQRDARVYLTRSVELDPLISTLTRLLTEHPDSYELIAPVREAIDEAMSSIKKSDAIDASGMPVMSDTLSDWKHLGRIFQKCNAVTIDAARIIREANDIVRRWDSELEKPPESPDLAPRI